MTTTNCLSINPNTVCHFLYSKIEGKEKEILTPFKLLNILLQGVSRNMTVKRRLEYRL